MAGMTTIGFSLSASSSNLFDTLSRVGESPLMVLFFLLRTPTSVQVASDGKHGVEQAARRGSTDGSQSMVSCVAPIMDARRLDWLEATSTKPVSGVSFFRSSSDSLRMSSSRSAIFLFAFFNCISLDTLAGQGLILGSFRTIWIPRTTQGRTRSSYTHKL